MNCNVVNIGFTAMLVDEYIPFFHYQQRFGQT
jgi:hypothetical protein